MCQQVRSAEKSVHTWIEEKECVRASGYEIDMKREIKEGWIEEMKEEGRSRNRYVYRTRTLKRSKMATREDEGIENARKRDIQKEKCMAQWMGEHE